MERTLNRFIESLCGVCREYPMDEKWLIAPSLRVGNQWLATAARSGVPVVNVRVKTLKHLALDLAGPEMARTGTALVSGAAAEIMVDAIMNERREASGGYLSKIRAGMEVPAAIRRTIDAIRLAGLSAKDLKPSNFEVTDKCKDLAGLMAGYESRLKKRNYLDYADVLRIAAKRLSEKTAESLRGALVLIPDNAESAALEKELISLFPEKSVLRLPVDVLYSGTEGGDAKKDNTATDLELLKYLNVPSAAPEPLGDGTVSIFQSPGETNEIKEVVRRCLSDGIGFDEVEILHTDTETYVPLIYELSEKCRAAGRELPVTFAEGIPVRYSRPGRALAGWLDWIRQGYPQKSIVRMIQDGVLNVRGMEDGGFNFTGIGALLRSVPIGIRRERYEKLLPEMLKKREHALGKFEYIESNYEEPEPEFDEAKRESLRKEVAGLRILNDFMRGLFDVCFDATEPARDVLGKAARFMDEIARRADETDNYAAVQLSNVIRATADVIASEEGQLVFDALKWLEGLSGSVRIMGRGPRPGHIHVDGVFSGGHSGRLNTFIVGLDDTRFPGGAVQDPIFLDSERAKTSKNLKLSQEMIEKKNRLFGELAARTRGRLTMSYSCRDLLEDREMFPSSTLIDAYRILSGERTGDQGSFGKWAGTPMSFAPDAEGKCLDDTELLLLKLLSGNEIENAEEIIFDKYPNLKQGAQAERARSDKEFTKYDGYVPRAGAANNPFAKDGPVMSASRLQRLAECPLAYFFNYILKIEPPEELEYDPGVWLDQLALGTMMHSVFELYMKKISEGGRLPESKDIEILMDILDKQIEVFRGLYPEPPESAFKRQIELIRKMAVIFHEITVKTSREMKPLYMEASIGLPASEGGTAIDRPEPIGLEVSSGTIRVRGRIDRIDEAPSGAKGRVFILWDYKTGGTYKYRNMEGPFGQGRVIQHALYTAMTEKLFAEKIPGKSAVGGFIYFFPSRRTMGEMIKFGPDDMSGWDETVGLMCGAAAGGCYIATDKEGDCAFCDYSEICGNVKSLAECSGIKITNAANTVLRPFGKLRGRI